MNNKMVSFKKHLLSVIFLILFLLITQAPKAIGDQNSKFLDLSIPLTGFEFNPTYWQTFFSIGLWLDKNGFELVGGSDIFSYNSTKFKYKNKYEGNNYWGVGIERTVADVWNGIMLGDIPTSEVAKYTESAIYCSLGTENPLFFDWLIYNIEGGYIFSFVDNFEGGNVSKYPHSRPYIDLSLKFRFFL